MKKITIVVLVFLTSFLFAQAQELPNLKDVKLNKKAQFKGTEQLTLKVIDYLFATPINKKNNKRNEAGQYLIRWMNGTPSYFFYLEEKETDFFNTDSDLMLMYMAALTKFTLENPTIKDQRSLVLGAMKLTLTYLGKQENKKSWSKSLYELHDAFRNDKLERFLF